MHSVVRAATAWGLCHHARRHAPFVRRAGGSSAAETAAAESGRGDAHSAHHSAAPDEPGHVPGARRALSPALSVVPSDALPVPLRPASHTAAAQTGTLQYVPEAMIDEVLPIVIDDDYVLCNGGDDTLVGHPIEMIKVDSPWPAVCKYCGLRYINKDMAAKNAEWAFLVGVRMRSFFSKCWPKSACQPPPVRSSLVWRCPRCRRTRQACRCTRALRRTALASRAAGS